LGIGYVTQTTARLISCLIKTFVHIPLMYVAVEKVGYLCKYVPAGPQLNSTWFILHNVVVIVVAQFERRKTKIISFYLQNISC